MDNEKYIQSVKDLSKAADIAIKSIKDNPPLYWNDEAVKHIISCYVEWKNDTLNPNPKFRNLTSLKYVNQRIFTMFQEGHGQFVEEFWKEIKAQDLPYKRENKMVKILKRKKINNIQEYDFVIDVILPYQQEGLISKDDVDLLNELITQFEMKKSKK